MKNDYQAVLQMVRSGESADEIDRVLCNDNTALTGKQIVALRVELIQRDLTAEQIGAAAWQAHLPVFELTTQHASLEEAFMQLTDDSVDFRSHHAAELVTTR